MPWDEEGRRADARARRLAHRSGRLRVGVQRPGPGRPHPLLALLPARRDRRAVARGARRHRPAGPASPAVRLRARTEPVPRVLRTRGQMTDVGSGHAHRPAPARRPRRGRAPPPATGRPGAGPRRRPGADVAVLPELWQIGYAPCPTDPEGQAAWCAHATGAAGSFVCRLPRAGRRAGDGHRRHPPAARPRRPRNAATLIDRHGEVRLTYARSTPAPGGGRPRWSRAPASTSSSSTWPGATPSASG